MAPQGSLLKMLSADEFNHNLSFSAPLVLQVDALWVFLQANKGH